MLGTTTASYHTPGAELLGNAIKSNEKIISIDNLLVAHASVANFDEAMSHYDIRAPYADALGRALALKYDKQCIQLAILAARAAATITGVTFGGSVLVNPAIDTDGEALADAIFDAAQALDEKDVPLEDRFVVVRPKHYHLLSRSTKVLNSDWGGKGAFSDGKVFRVAGVEIIKSNNVPSTVISADVGVNNTYDGDFSNTIGCVFQKQAIGTVELMGMALEKDYSVRHQATIMVAKLAVGHGFLRPECAIELKKA